jgi:hypothetical protein
LYDTEKINDYNINLHTKQLKLINSSSTKKPKLETRINIHNKNVYIYQLGYKSTPDQVFD